MTKLITKPSLTAVTLLTAGFLLLGNLEAQQTPPANPPAQAPAAKSQAAPGAKTSQTPATTAKTGQGTAVRKPAVLTLKTPKEKASYAIGVNIGRGLHRDSVDVDPAVVARGLRDGLGGAKTLLTDEEMKGAMVALQTELRKKLEVRNREQQVRSKEQEAQMLQMGEANKKEGEAFLAANKTKDDVVTLPSGLQYKILKEGDGPKPTATDSVVCNYNGTLLNNTEFDSSYKRGQPATFNVGQVIHGWTEALQLMPVGSKWQLFIPSELAYGPGGSGPVIGPNATLIFEVELLSIQGK
jgi:FKBP-type peptidyl-prolyl cis-trans isomerase FklB